MSEMIRIFGEGSQAISLAPPNAVPARLIEQTRNEQGSPSNLQRPILLDIHDAATWNAVSASVSDIDGVVISKHSSETAAIIWFC